MKKTVSLMLTVILILGLSGCGHTVGKIDLEAGQSAIYIEKDGSVSYAVAEKFDKEYYSEDKLEEKIEQEIEEYNRSSEASVKDAIDIDDFDVKSDVATLVLDFETAYDFMTYIHGYNKTDKTAFYLGTVKENSDCKIEGKFLSPDGKKNVTSKEISKMKDKNILIVNEQYTVQIDSDIEYISENCKVDDDGFVTTAKQEDGLSYIIY